MAESKFQGWLLKELQTQPNSLETTMIKNLDLVTLEHLHFNEESCGKGEGEEGDQIHSVSRQKVVSHGVKERLFQYHWTGNGIWTIWPVAYLTYIIIPQAYTGFYPSATMEVASSPIYFPSLNCVLLVHAPLWEIAYHLLITCVMIALAEDNIMLLLIACLSGLTFLSPHRKPITFCSRIF